jgi:poly-gamma-glutamate synthesis protein (capsule biosynthesis protein)
VYNENSATVAYARAGYLDDMKSTVAQAAARCDFLLVCFHWGTEFRHDVSDAQIEIAHAAVDSGASAVFGTHPHVLQGKETYQGAPIYYSIGNFVFDKQLPEGTDEAVIVQLTVSKGRIISLRELPVVIEDCQPRLAEEQAAAEITENLMRYSRRFVN